MAWGACAECAVGCVVACGRQRCGIAWCAEDAGQTAWRKYALRVDVGKSDPDDREVIMRIWWLNSCSCLVARFLPEMRALLRRLLTWQEAP